MSAFGSEVFVAGGAMSAFGRRKDGTGPRDWVPEVVSRALLEAHMQPSDIDAVVVATESDFLSMQVSPSAVLADDLGLTQRPVMRVEAGGASGAMAVRTALMHLLSGWHDTVLVVGCEHAASHLPADEVRTIYGLSFDADLEGLAGVTATVLYALSIQDHMARYGTTAQQLAAVSVKNHGNARFNPDAHKPMVLTVDDVLASPMVSTPYRMLDCSLISDGASALVLTTRKDTLDRRYPRVRLVGSGCASDAVRLAERSQRGDFQAKSLAAQRAYAQAGVKDPAAQMAFAEVYDAYTGAEVQAIEALQLSAPGQAAPALAQGMFDRGQRLPVNLSGGLIGQGSAPGATGIAQVYTLLRLLQGRYHSGLQQASERRFAVSDTHGGVGTVCVVHVLERLDD